MTSDGATQPAGAMLQRALAELHQARGSPSARALAKRIGARRVSHGTISSVLKGRLIKWPKLLLVIQALDGDTGRFWTLWEAAREERLSSKRAADTNVPRAAVEPASRAEAEGEMPTASLLGVPRGDALDLQETLGGIDLAATLANYVELLAKSAPPRPGPAADPTVGLRQAVERLNQLLPTDGAQALSEMPRERAALALAALSDQRAKMIIKRLGTDAVMNLILALPPDSAARAQLTAWSPPTARFRSASSE